MLDLTMEGIMQQRVIELERILSREKELYEEILSIEEDKSSSISDRNGKEIEELSLRQEKLLRAVEKLDNERVDIITAYSRESNLMDYKSGLTLFEVVRNMDEDSSAHLIRIGMELKKILARLKMLQNLNHTMLRDNLKFFDILISGLRNDGAMSCGYGKNGKEEDKLSSSLLINKTA